jgi:sugar lactone lactonase YvrE
VVLESFRHGVGRVPARLLACFLLGWAVAPAVAQTLGTIQTVAGGGIGEGLAATQANLSSPMAVARDNSGNLYVADTGHHRVRRIAVGSGIITTVAGTGDPGFSGDGGPATQAQLDGPEGLFVDANNNLYISDTGNDRVRRVTADGRISTFLTGLKGPTGIVVERDGTLFVSDTGNNRVVARETNGEVSTFAGGGAGGDGEAGPDVSLSQPMGLAQDRDQTYLYVAEAGAGRVRQIVRHSLIVDTVAGGGSAGDGDDARSAFLPRPVALAADGNANLYIVSGGGPNVGSQSNRVRRVDVDENTIRTVATGFDSPAGIVLEPGGSLVLAESGRGRLLRLSTSGGTPTTIAGGGVGDDGPATNASLLDPADLVLDGAGGLLIVESPRHRVRRVSLSDGRITTVIGEGTPGYAGDGGPADRARLDLPGGLTLHPLGFTYVADSANHRIRVIDQSGTITTGAGTGPTGRGQGGFAGEGAPADQARFNNPQQVAIDGIGNLYISDTGNHRVRKAEAGTGLIVTVAGTGSPGAAGDGGSGASAQLNAPVGLAVDPSGNLYIADTANHRVRRVSARDGTISTVAGTGDPGFAGDFGPATAARLNRPRDLALDRSGNLYIADEGNHRVRRVDARTGAITTLAGTGTSGFSGDGGAATAAALSAPSTLVVDGNTLYIADGGNGRVRAVSMDLTRPEVTFQTSTGPGGRPAVRVNATDPNPSTRVLRVTASGSNLVVNGESLPFEFAAPLGGLPSFGFLAEKGDPAAPAAMVVTAVDGAGNAARPAWFSMGASGSTGVNLSLPPIRNTDLTLTLINEGLEEIRLEIAGRPLILRADTTRIGFDGDVAFVKPRGASVLSIRRFVGDGGPVTVTVSGPANASGVIEIHP